MLYVLIGCSLIQLAYWWYAYRSNLAQDRPTSTSDAAVTVLIAARDEADRIPPLMEGLVAQSYANMQVIVVDDRSTDNTAHVVRQWSDRLDVTVITVDEDHPGKKHALSLGIDAATTEWILCTDADCVPRTADWVSTMMSRRADHVAVIGYGPLQAQGGIASWLAAGEAAWTASHYLSAAAAGRPYMAVGRNFLFSRSAYHSAGGYASHAEVASGDDDLLVHDLMRIGSIGIATDGSASVDSPAVASLGAWLRQKRRHLSTATRYSATSQRDLGIFAGTHLMVVGMAGICIAAGYEALTIAVLGIKYACQWLLTYRWYRAIDQLKYWRAIPILETVLAIFYLVLSPYLWWHKKTW